MEQRFCPNDGAALRSTGSEDPLIGQVIADRYQVLELIGEGGMGRVYLAEHVRMGRKSALKVMSPNLALSADAISRFNREAANASRINHPNIAQIYDFGETSTGMLYLAMEFVEGETLRALIEHDGPLPLARAANVTNQIADALSAAHHMGIVHRDLKPDNVMIARRHDGTDWVKVVDFGIAKTVQGSGEGAGSQTVTTAGVSLGTPEYMSPEQLAGERLDSRTDQYSLGIVLFNMLTGDLPYPRVTSRETLVRRLTTKPRSLSDVCPDVEWPTALEAALDRALSPETSARYSLVQDFGRDVVSAASSTGAIRSIQAAPTYVIRPSEPTQRIAVPATPLGAAPAQQRDRGQEPVPRARTRRVKRSPPSTRRRALALSGVLLVLGAFGAGAVVAARSLRTGGALHVAAGHAIQRPDTVAPIASSTLASPAPIAASGPATAAPAVSDTTARETTANVATPRVATPGVATPVHVPAHKDSTPVEKPVVPAAGPHAWIQPNGDSGAVRRLPPDATDDQRVAYLVDEIRGHMARANQLLLKADVPKMRSEIHNAQSDVAMLRTLFPTAADTLRVQQGLRAAAIRLVESCPAVLADTTKHFPPTFTCGQLFPNLTRGRQGRLARRPNW